MNDGKESILNIMNSSLCNIFMQKMVFTFLKDFYIRLVQILLSIKWNSLNCNQFQDCFYMDVVRILKNIKSILVILMCYSFSAQIVEIVKLKYFSCKR